MSLLILDKQETATTSTTTTTKQQMKRKKLSFSHVEYINIDRNNSVETFKIVQLNLK
jgi:hypothetical protein